MRAFAVLLLLAGTAYAQAPGQVSPGQVPATPAGPPGPAGPAGPPRASVMDDRWAVALGLMTEGLNPKAKGTSNVQFVGLELAARYRITPPIEIALALSAAGSAGTLSTASVFADFRYRFFAERPWNVYLLGGLGIVSAGDKNGTDAQKQGRGAIRFGLGGERRFGRLAIHAELRLLGVAENKAAANVNDNSAGGHLARDSLGGGALELGATYYF